MDSKETQTTEKPSKYSVMAKIIVDRAVVSKGDFAALITEEVVFGDGAMHPIEPSICANIWTEFLRLTDEEKAAGRKDTASTAAAAKVVEQTINLLEAAEATN